jgi:hypothetical protein
MPYCSMSLKHVLNKLCAGNYLLMFEVIVNNDALLLFIRSVCILMSEVLNLRQATVILVYSSPGTPVLFVP